MYDANETEAHAAAQLRPVYREMMEHIDRVLDAQLSRADDAAEIAIGKFFLCAACLVPVDAPSRQVWHTIATLLGSTFRPASGMSDWCLLCETRTGALNNLCAIGGTIEQALKPLRRHMRYTEPIDQLLKENVNRRQICQMYGLMEDNGNADLQAIYEHEAGRKLIPTPPPVECIEARADCAPCDNSSLLAVAHAIAKELEMQPA